MRDYRKKKGDGVPTARKPKVLRDRKCAPDGSEAKNESGGRAPYMRAYRRERNGVTSCEICHVAEVVDTHHDGPEREVHYLCPTHHACITRGYYTLAEMLQTDPLLRNTEQVAHFKKDLDFLRNSLTSLQLKVAELDKRFPKDGPGEPRGKPVVRDPGPPGVRPIGSNVVLNGGYHPAPKDSKPFM
jgi:hypothetical protein